MDNNRCKNIFILVFTTSFLTLFLESSFSADKPTTKGIAVQYRADQKSFRKVDYAAAKPMPMPKITQDLTRLAKSLWKSSSAEALRADNSYYILMEGSVGTGAQNPVYLISESEFLSRSQVLRDAQAHARGEVTTKEYGSDRAVPYTTSRVDLGRSRMSEAYPYRTIGKLFFLDFSGSSFECSASLIEPGILLTAAHCVTAYGSQQFYTDFEFVHAFYIGEAPYGIWEHHTIFVSSSFFDGTAAV